MHSYDYPTITSKIYQQISSLFANLFVDINFLVNYLIKLFLVRLKWMFNIKTNPKEIYNLMPLRKQRSKS
jgi:hypothetical protein